MAADNAIIIGLIAANFAPKHRKQIIMWGVFAAFLFRIIFAFSAVYLFNFAIIKIVGGLLLVWIVNDLRQDLFGKQKKINIKTYIPRDISNNYYLFEHNNFYNKDNFANEKFKNRVILSARESGDNKRPMTLLTQQNIYHNIKLIF